MALEHKSSSYFSKKNQVRSWFNLKTGKVEDKKIDTSVFDEVHDDALQLYKVRKQLKLTNESSTTSTRLIYLLENEFDANPRMRIVIPP